MNTKMCNICDEPLEKSDPSPICYACETEAEIMADAQDFIDEVSMYEGLDF
jgi:hypothetical protein